MKELKLKWYVTHDDTPFVNRGTDWTLLFKTGDGCDLQNGVAPAGEVPLPDHHVRR